MDGQTCRRDERIIKSKAKIIRTKTSKSLIIKITYRKKTLGLTAQTKTINRRCDVKIRLKIIRFVEEEDLI